MHICSYLLELRECFLSIAATCVYIERGKCIYIHPHKRGHGDVPFIASSLSKKENRVNLVWQPLDL